MAKQTTRSRAARKQAAETQPDALSTEEAAAHAEEAPPADAAVSIASEANASAALSDGTGEHAAATDTIDATVEEAPAVEGSAPPAEAPADAMPTASALQRAPVTQPLNEPEPPLASAPEPVEQSITPAEVTAVAAPMPPAAARVDEADPDATAQRPVIPGGPLVSRPRWNTLAGAIAPAASAAQQDDTPTLQAPFAPAGQAPSTPAAGEQSAPQGADMTGDEIGDEVDEWSIADQPTVQLSPQTLPQLAEQARQLRATQPPQSLQSLQALQSLQTRPTQQIPPPNTPAAPPALQRPAPFSGEDEAPNERDTGNFLTETSEHLSWPPRPSITTRTPIAPEDAPTQEAVTPKAPTPRPPARPTRPTTPYTSPAPRRPTFTSPNEPRLASPQGRVVPSPPPGVSPAEMSNPRMRRFQELRRQRVTHEHGDAAPEDTPQVAQVVRQWWSDLRPGLGTALEYQHEARSSGLHPIPAHEPAPSTSRLGDVFGRLARTARELTERAQSAVGPHIGRLHDQMEQAAQGLINRLDGGPARQQAPFLGPGRIAVFFRQGVAVGQAQRLLMNSSARPMRLIPRKHGFLASVRPGMEAAVCDQLRRHPYVRDVAYLEYDEYGQPLDDENEEYEEYDGYEQADDEYDDDMR